MPNAFVIKEATFVLLTFSQINNDDEALAWQILQLLSELGGECIIARELHRDGGLHLHVLCEFDRPISTRDQRKFDLLGYHPNIRKVSRGTEDTVWDYVTKDGDVILGGLERPSADSRDKNRERRCWEGEYTSKWAYICDAATRDEFFSRLQSEDPRALACSYTSVTKYADWKYKPHAEEYCHPSDFEFNLESLGELRQWVDESLCDSCTQDR